MRRSTAKKIVECDGIEKRRTQKTKHNLSGRRVGRLIVIDYTQERNSSGKGLWLCMCDCGKETKATTQDLLRELKKSCGCLKRERLRKHGLSKTNLYRRWADMLSRCRCKTSNNYKYYGGVGVSVCTEWEQFENFCEWALKNGYRKNLSIDRIDVNGNYEPANCRWATREEQDNNRRDSVRVENNGRIYTIKEISQITKLTEHGIGERLKNGVTGNELFYPPHRGKKPHEFKEETKCSARQRKSM